MMNGDNSAKEGIIETIKNAMEPESIANKVGIDKNVLIDIGLYGAIGFIAGFLIKKYSEYFIALVLLLIGMFVLQQFEYITVSLNIQKLHTMLGLQSASVMGESYLSLLSEWARANIPAATSLSIGFLIGLKIG